MINILATYTNRLFKVFTGEIIVLPSRAFILFLFIMLLLIPVFMRHPHYLNNFLTLACIYAIFAASWDLLSGFTGQMNFGHAIFFGVSAYTAALLNIHLSLAPWLTIPIGALAAVLVGLLIGIPCLRLKGTYLAFATLAFPLILTGLVLYFGEWTGGEMGVSAKGTIDLLSSSPVVRYYIAAILVVVLGFIMWKITDSKIGIIFHAIREDEVTVKASGINTTKYKLLAFCLSGFFAGIAGGLYVHHIGIAGPSTLALLLSFQVVIWSIFGGIATIYGPILGVFIIHPLTKYLDDSSIFSDYSMLIIALLILLVMLFMPDGLTTWIRDKIEKVCPRCKLRNIAVRKTCRVCTAELD